MDWQGIAAVITALGVIVLGWFQYNQHTKNKETDDRLKRREEEDKEKRNADKVASQNIYRELWSLLHKLDGALRVYIVQPHPLDRAKFISIQYEVLSEGMVSIMPLIHRMPISNLPGFVVELESNEFLFWHSQAEVKDGRARSIMHQIGTDQMVAVRMKDGEVWKGNIVVDFDSNAIDAEAVQAKLMEAKTVIKYMLPEIEE
ncbi:MAG: hypothetical protein J6C56_04875 [Alistipes sp.]|nr:hypothetical protein [Alistipes sp.]